MTTRCASITARQFFDGHQLRENVRIDIDEVGRVSAISHHASHHDFFLASTGLVDLQVNGFDRHDLSDIDDSELSILEAQLAREGTIAFLGTLVTAPLHILASRVATLSGWISDGHHSMAGIHLEGPFLGQAPGAHPTEFIREGDLEWIDTLPRTLRMMTIAAEIPSAPEVIRSLAQRGVVVSLGHSRPSRHDYERAISAGARSITHLFNAMSGIHHRESGLAAFSLIDDRVSKGLIADGVHLSDDIGILASRAIPAHLRFLVSDCIAWNGRWARERDIRIRDGAPRLPSGTLAGTAVTLAQCVAHAVRRWNWPLEEALRSASVVPCDLIGIPQPRVEIGWEAFLVCWADDLSVVEVIDGRPPRPA